MKLTRQDQADMATAGITMRYIAHLVHAQDHRLTTAETRKLNGAKSVLETLQNRIRHQVEP